MILRSITLVFAALTLAACGDERQASSSGSASASIPASVFVDTAPDQPVGVHTAIKNAKVGEEIVVYAVVGGRKKAFVDGRAVLVLTDAKLAPCDPECGCPTPWDYCCETHDTLRENVMTMQVVGDNDKPLPVSLEGQGGLDELKTVIVKGKVRSNEGSLVLDAEQIHVKAE